jgi:hypothetical protein
MIIRSAISPETRELLVIAKLITLNAQNAACSPISTKSNINLGKHNKQAKKGRLLNTQKLTMIDYV